MPIVPLVLALALQSRFQVTVTVRAGSDEEKKRLSRYGRQAQAKIEDAFPKILKILDYNGRGQTNVQIIVADDLQPTDGKIAWTNTHWDPNTVWGDICVPAQSANPADLGMMVHELMHVVQVGYRDCPSWLVEGIADYVRYYWFDPPSRRPHSGKGADCTNGYGTTAEFLDWTAHRYAPNLLRALDQGFRSGQSTEQIFSSATRKSLTQLNTEWKATLR
jgi:hypothetical protein